ncbi:MAG: MFS transporter, partial [Acidovorax sp.]|nr:MFS transporter [Acidovorax sp.]
RLAAPFVLYLRYGPLGPQPGGPPPTTGHPPGQARGAPTASALRVVLLALAGALAALWGQVAALSSVHMSLALAALTGVLVMALVQRLVSNRHGEEDLSASRAFQAPRADSPPAAGLRLVVSIEYFINPARAAEFRAVMQESRRARLRQGALSWELQHDIADPRRYVERVVDESWTEHLRRFDRVTASDVALRDRRFAFHVGDAPPVVSRYVVEGE